MGDWKDFPLPDGSYSDSTRPWTQQDVVNYLPTFAEQSGTRSRLKHACVPGLKPYAVVGDGPHRGAHDVEGRLFVVSGTTLYRVTATGVAVTVGTIPGTSRVSMAHNQIDGGNELIVATGSNSYVYNTVADTLTATGIPLLFVDFINQTIVGVDVGRRFWRYSGLADAGSWNDLDVESAESSPDRLVGVAVSQGEVLLFGERTVEVFANSVTESSAFQRTAVIEKGCANGNTICRLDNTVYFCGNDGIPYRLQGYTPVPIAPKAITTAIAAGDPTKLFAFTWEDRGYVVYYLTAQDGQTWGYDVTCQRWHRRESFGLDRWRLNTLVKSNGDWYGGDYSNGNLYELEWGYMYECQSAVIPRRIRSGVMHNSGNRVFVHGLKLSMDTGLWATTGIAFPEQPDGPSISGTAPDGVIGQAYDGYTYTVTEGDAAIVSVKVVSGSLPAGLSMSNAGVIDAGTPTEIGSDTFTIRVTDANGLWAELTDTINIGFDFSAWEATNISFGIRAYIEVDQATGQVAAINYQYSDRAYSEEGDSFTIYEATNPIQPIGIAWSPTLEVFATTSDAANGRYYTSAVGSSWSLHTSAFSLANRRGFCWSPELEEFATVDGAALVTSPDGETYTATNKGLSGVSAIRWSAVIGGYITAGSKVFTSDATASTFTERTVTGTDYTDIAESDSLVAMCCSGKVTVTADGETFTDHDSPITFACIEWVPFANAFVAAGKSSEIVIYTSPDVESGWTLAATLTGETAAPHDLAYSTINQKVYLACVATGTDAGRIMVFG